MATKDEKKTKKELIAELEELRRRFESNDEKKSGQISSEEVLRFTKISADRMADAAFWMGPDAKLVYVNDAACRSLSYSREELLNMTVHDFDPDFPREVWPLHWEEVKKQGSFSVESRHRRKDGTVFPVEIMVNYLEFEGKEYNCAFARDISERKKAEKELHHYESIINYTKDMLALVDRNFEYLAANRMYLEAFGLIRENVIGNSISNIFGEEFFVNVIRPNAVKCLQGNEIRYNDWFDFPAYGRKYMEVAYFPYTGSDNEISGFVVSAHDISEKHESEMTLRESEERLALFKDSATEAFTLYDSELNIIDNNKASLRMFHPGQKREDVIGKNLRDIVPNFKETGRYEQFMEVIRTGKALSLEDIIPHPKFGDRCLAVVAFKVGEGLGTITRDITESRKAEEELTQSEREHRELLENLHAAVVVHAPDTKILFSNRMASEILGLTEEQMKGKAAANPGWCFVREDGQPMPLEEYPVNRVIATNQPLKNYIVGVNRPDRDYTKWVICNAYPTRDSEDKRISVIVTFVDFTQLKHVEMALHESQMFNESIINMTPDVIYVYDINERKNVYSNEGIMKILGYSVEEIKEMGEELIERLMDPDDFKVYLSETIPRYLTAKDNELIEHEYRMQHKNGEWRWLHSKESIFIRNDDGSPKQIFGLIADVTAQKLAERKLQQYSEQLELMVEERTRKLEEAQEKLIRKERLAALGELSGSVAHELRNPLGIISNAIFYLENILADEDPSTREYLNIMVSEIRNSERIISDLLDFSRIKTVKREIVALDDLVSRVLRQREVPESISVQISQESGTLSVRVDPLQIERVVDNLILNACQAMPDGGVLKIATRQDNSKVILTFSDTGIGISNENHQKIFEPLYTTKATGIGLGLALSRNFVEVNGGVISVKSEVGEGSVFTVTLPVAK